MPSWQELSPFSKCNEKPLEDFTQGNVMVCLTFLKEDSD